MAGVLQLPASFKPTHQTDGLPGYPAVDVFGSPGETVAAPAAGTLTNVHLIPWDLVKRVGGWTGYLVTSTGTYFLTHLGSILPSGSVVSAGSPIGTLAAVPSNAWQPHVHEGLSSATMATSSASGSSSTGSASASAITTPDQFWYAVETKIGAPHTRATHDFLVAWSSVEGTKAHWNPLATTLQQPGSTPLPGNTSGVQQYPTPDAGVQATADTIKGYPTILAVLRGKASPFGNAALYRELNIWSGHRDQGAAQTPYVRSVLLNFQGNPKGQGAADWASYDAGNLANDTGVTAAASAIMAVPNFLGKITNVHNILRGLQIVAGAVLVLAGVMLLARQVALANDLPDPLKADPVPV